MIKELTDLGFVWQSRGLWINDDRGLCITLDDDYRNTFRAFHHGRPIYQYIVRNAAGNEKRYRTALAAARDLIKGA